MSMARQTFERRQLGLTLRRLRERSGRSRQDAAEKISRALSRIVQLENGNGTVSASDLEKLLDFYDVTGAERNTVDALGVEARKRSRKSTYTDVLPGSFQRFADLEGAATHIAYYDSGLIPAILQSADYVSEEIKSGDGIWWEQPSPAERASRETLSLIHI